MEEVSYPSIDRIVADAPPAMTKFKVEVDEAKGIGLVTINRPEKLNAFTMGYPTDRPRPDGWTVYDLYMRAITQELKFDKRMRVIVVTGAGRAFSAGADIKDWSELEQNAKTEKSPFSKEGLLIDESTAMMNIWFKHLMKPTIAMVNGPAVGMGADLAASCDMRVMSENAYFQWAYILNHAPSHQASNRELLAYCFYAAPITAIPAAILNFVPARLPKHSDCHLRPSERRSCLSGSLMLCSIRS